MIWSVYLYQVVCTEDVDCEEQNSDWSDGEEPPPERIKLFIVHITLGNKMYDSINILLGTKMYDSL